MLLTTLRFDYYTNTELKVTKTIMTFDAPLGKIPILIRGGSVIPTQQPAVNTEKSRNNPFGLIIALDSAGKAEGSLYWDEGDSLDPLESGNFVHFTFTVSDVSFTYGIK